MRFLIDAQLPPALARWFESAGHAAQHVADIDMVTATDREIWRYAESSDAVIVTKDEDFSRTRSLATDGPPIVWIRRGNTSRKELLEWFEPLLPVIIDALERGESVIEVR